MYCRALKTHSGQFDLLTNQTTFSETLSPKFLTLNDIPGFFKKDLNALTRKVDKWDEN